MLGVLAGLPASILTSVNNETIAYLFGQLNLILLIALFSLKISRLIVTGIFIQWNFLVCKVYLGPKRKRGLRHPTVQRMQRRLNNAVVAGRRHKWPILFLYSLITFLLIASTFFQIENRHVLTTPTRAMVFSIIVFGGLMAILGTMVAYRVGSGRTHSEFFSSNEGRSVALVAIIWLCMLFGMARSFSMMHGPTVNYSFENGVCQLTPMMPIYGGDLFFDRDSYNFLVLKNGRIAFYVPHTTPKAAPKAANKICLSRSNAFWKPSIMT